MTKSLAARVAALEEADIRSAGFAVWYSDEGVTAYHPDGRTAPIDEIPDRGTVVVINTFGEPQKFGEK